jgi:hypothetical protein
MFWDSSCVLLPFVVFSDGPKLDPFYRFLNSVHFLVFVLVVDVEIEETRNQKQTAYQIFKNSEGC